MKTHKTIDYDHWKLKKILSQLLDYSDAVVEGIWIIVYRLAAYYIFRAVISIHNKIVYPQN